MLDKKGSKKSFQGKNSCDKKTAQVKVMILSMLSSKVTNGHSSCIVETTQLLYAHAYRRRKEERSLSLLLCAGMTRSGLSP